MSHIFISYAHADKTYIDKLLAWFESKSFAAHDYWYDQHIESGANWRDDITEALDQAFAILVVVTEASVKSLYCVYEWAYAMGQGIPVLPLLFEELSITDIPSPLRSQQFTDCTERIPDLLHEQLNRLKSVPPQIAVINRTIYEVINDTHRRFFILGWIGDGLEALSSEYSREILAYFSSESLDAQQKLQTLLLDRASALSSKQYRLLWTITNFLGEFVRLHQKIDNYLQTYLYPQFDSHWLPAFEYFEGSGYWRQWVRRYFERSFEDEDTRMQVFAEMMRAFPISTSAMLTFLLRTNGSINHAERPKCKQICMF
ncbi:MAG: toll/interleukin-1 receptor domain-containing protein [Anaerolineae bacterium]|nr:toll/interleukin-1 receptor domain-containing protein [Anaerolineae bacterium]